MFEGLVRQVLLGYLGQYIKDIQKEQLKITLWNEEVLLENVELILEAFEYLQLPFSLKQGKVGRLSIKIPWKKLGWDPIIIVLEDVHLSASQRNDDEWIGDAVERREWAAKKAKLTAAELGKLSRRVCDNQSGHTFISYIAGKILENIQVSIRNVHIMYHGGQHYAMQAATGLLFSSLTIVKQNSSPVWSSRYTPKIGQISKVADIHGLALYCNIFHGPRDLEGLGNWQSKWSEADKYDFIVAPFDASLLVVKSGKLEHDFPQYSIMAELGKVELFIDAAQLQHLLALSDYISMCRLREKYGRYRPWAFSLSSKPHGWQKMWWRYALDSVLVDARKKLKRTSWRYLGQRLLSRRKYVQLYKIKLELFQKEQPVDSNILVELEKMEKDNEISDILNFRSIAERKLEDALLNFSSSEIREGSRVPGDKLQTDEPSSNKARGWLNWLSRGVLGAGGTDDSGQFSGVVSDEIIKDICEATKFQPGVLAEVNGTPSGAGILAALNLNISQISLLACNRLLSQEIAQLSFNAVAIDCRASEDSAVMTAKIESAGVLDLLKNVNILVTKKGEQSSTGARLDVTYNHEADLLVKAMLQPLEIYCDLEFVLNLIELFNVLKNLKHQQDLVWVSLNGIKDDQSRLLSKAEIILKDHMRVLWDVMFSVITVHIPCIDMDAGPYVAVVDARDLHISSKSPFASDTEHWPINLDEFLKSAYSIDRFNVLDLKRFYLCSVLSLRDFEIRLLMPSFPSGISLVDISSTFIVLASCIIPEEVILAQLMVYITLPLLQLHFSPTIHGAILKMDGLLQHLYSKANTITFGSNYSMQTDSTVPFRYCLEANVELVKMEIDLEDEDTNNSILLLILEDLKLRYDHAEFEDAFIRVKSLKMVKIDQEAEVGCHCVLISNFDQQCATANGCFHLHYKNKRIGALIQHSWDVSFNDSEVHCYPKVVGVLTRFCNKLAACHGASATADSICNMDSRCSDFHGFCFQRFGLSNFCENGFSGWGSIPSDQFPFVTIYNSGCLSNLEEFLIHPISEWRAGFKVGSKRIRSPSSDALSIPLSKFLDEASEVPLIGSSSNSNVTQIDLAVSNLKVHFHDMLSTVGTIIAPFGKVSVVSCSHSLDVLCSTKGLSLSSLWWKRNFQEYLWGPSQPDYCPILNFRLRKGDACSSTGLELSFGVQHACCIIPPEYLAILIGYFSLPDWRFNENDDIMVHEQAHTDTEIGAVVYKFEVLDCTIMSPVNNSETSLLKLEIPQLYCSFTLNDVSDNLFTGVTSECVLPADKMGSRFNSLNLFGRGLSLCIFSNCMSDSSPPRETERECCPLIESVDVDLWIRIPSGNPPLYRTSTPATLFMARISSCQLLLGGGFPKSGFDALLEIINQYSTVEEQSKYFLSDVPQFLQLKSSSTDNPSFASDKANIALMEIKVYSNPCSLLLYQPRDSNSQEMVANLDATFTLSASLRNEVVASFDIQFSSLVLSSLLASVTLVKCVSNNSVSPALEVCLTTVEDGEEQVLISLPALDVWMHWSNWSAVVDVLSSYFEQHSQDSVLGNPNLVPDLLDLPENMVVSQDSSESQGVPVCTESNDLPINGTAITVRSERVNLFCHFPVSGSEQASAKLETADVRYKRALSISDFESVDEHCNFFTITSDIRSVELIVSGATVKLRSTFEKTTGTMEEWDSGGTQSCPLLQLSNLILDLKTSDYMVDIVHVKADIHFETCDIWLSNQPLFFWHGIQFGGAKADSSEFLDFNLDLSVECRKISVLLTDGTWSCNGPLVHLVMRNVLLENNICRGTIRSFIAGDLLINCNNIRKVLWEPFVEPWNFQLSVFSKHDRTALLDGSALMDIRLKSTEQLNINVTEALIEVLFRIIEMIKDSLSLMSVKDICENHGFQTYQCLESRSARRYAPYVIYNLTSLPFVFYVYEGLVAGDNLDVSTLIQEDAIPPGSSIPVYVDESLEKKVLHYRPGNSSDGLNKKQSNVAGHHFVTIQFEGTSVPSEPISMDLAGLTYFEVNFSKDNRKTDADTGFLVPVVFDVSVERYSKVIRLYSTVSLLNLTSVPLELLFDIPFGVSPKIIDPIYPGQEFHLPLHLAEVGQMRWRPRGDNYLWSESYNLSSILSPDSRAGHLRPLVCYPASPNSDPYRCCLSVQDMSLPLSGVSKTGSSSPVNLTVRQTSNGYESLQTSVKSRFIHQVMLSTPLLVKNYLLQPVSLRIECGGMSRSMLLSKVETSFFSVDSSFDLVMTLEIGEFKPSSIKFPRADIFSSMAKPSGTFLSLIETISLVADSSEGVIYVTVEKMLDASSGARELRISVPFLLYNCTGYTLSISRSDHGRKGNCCVVPSCYNTEGNHPIIWKKDGLGLISPIKILKFGHNGTAAKTHVCSRANFCEKSSLFPTGSSDLCESSTQNAMEFHGIDDPESSSSDEHLLNTLSDSTASDFVDNQGVNVKPFMYSPDPSIPASEIMVRISKYIPEWVMDNQSNSSWSNSFFLLAPSGSTTVFVPESSSNSVSVVSVTSNLLANPFSGRTRAITFQPRYIISNASSKNLTYKQKGTDVVFHLGIGQHSHLHWPDITREMLVSVRVGELGWQWSGGFSPDHLGDTQVKMRNYISGALHMLRVEVQNADDVHDEKIVGDTSTNSGTLFIILSDDDSGFIPYRIDNFSKETLRIYQQQCETLETIVHPYTSCSYAWDEPCYPHRLIVEVPGDRIIGAYTLDDVKEYTPVHLPSSSEKRERTLLSSVHAEGALKVLSVVDSTCHIVRDVKHSSSVVMGDVMIQDQRDQKFVKHKENISIAIPFLGVSFINSSPQELVFASARNITIDLSQNSEQQQISFQIFSLQIDNMLRNTPYPVMLFFDKEQKNNLIYHNRSKNDGGKSTNDNLVQCSSGSLAEPVICISAAKWRNKNVMLRSFEHISLRIADFHLELDQEVILILLDFVRVAMSTLCIPDVPIAQSGLVSSHSNKDSAPVSDACLTQCSEVSQANGHLNFSQYSNFQNSNFPQRPHTTSPSLPKIVPMGAPWQKIYLLARRHNKIYVEAFYLAPIKLTVSFSSNPWMLKNVALASGESVVHRGLLALADIEGAQISLRKLTITHHIGSWESMRDIVIKHYSKECLHEMYKLFGSAGVIGNPMGFARRVGLGLKDFLSVPAQGVLQSPAGLITGVAQGTGSLLNNTLYAISDAATQFSKAAHKGILAFTLDSSDGDEMENQQIVASSYSKGVISELLEGLTGLLQSPIRGAEKHGLPGVLSGFALGVTGLVAKPAASVLEATGRTAQSIRNRSRLHRMGHRRFRVRLPRPLRRDLPIKPYSWEEAVGTAVLIEADDGSRFKDEVLVICKRLKDLGKFVVVTERLILVVECPSLIQLGNAEFGGISADPEWIVEVEISLESVIHADVADGIVHIVRSGSETSLRQNQPQQKRTGGGRADRWNRPSLTLPLFQNDLQLASGEDTDYFLRVLLSTIEQGKERGWGNTHLLHRSNLR